MNIEELKKIVRGNGFQESHGSTTIVIDVETVVDLLDQLKQCDMPVVNVSDCDRLLNDLDEYAKSYDPYEYGLPIGFVDSDVELNEQREIVRNWFHSR